MALIFERGISETIQLRIIPEENLFQLKPIDPNRKAQIHWQVNFQRMRIEGKGVYSTTPRFFANNSQIYNSFYKPLERPTEPANLLEACYCFGLHRDDILRQNSEMYVVRPSGKHCSVCKQAYLNYTDHVNSEEHLYKQRHNVFNLYMDDLRKVLDRDRQKESRRRRNRKERVQIMIDSD